jgi:glutaredoxin
VPKPLSTTYFGETQCKTFTSYTQTSTPLTNTGKHTSTNLTKTKDFNNMTSVSPFEPRWHVYGKPHCPYCNYAEDFLMNLEIPYTKVDVTLDRDARTFIKDHLGFKTVPVIIDNRQTIIGGYQELVKHFENNQSITEDNLF